MASLGGHTRDGANMPRRSRGLVRQWGLSFRKGKQGAAAASERADYWRRAARGIAKGKEKKRGASGPRVHGEELGGGDQRANATLLRTTASIERIECSTNEPLPSARTAKGSYAEPDDGAVATGGGGGGENSKQ